MLNDFSDLILQNVYFLLCVTTEVSAWLVQLLANSDFLKHLSLPVFVKVIYVNVKDDQHSARSLRALSQLSLPAYAGWQAKHDQQSYACTDIYACTDLIPGNMLELCKSHMEILLPGVSHYRGGLANYCLQMLSTNPDTHKDSYL